MVGASSHSRSTLSGLDVPTILGLLALSGVVGVYGTIIGAGGGFLVVPALLVLFDLEPTQAVGTTVATMLIIHIAGAWAYDRDGLVNRPVAAWYVVISMPVALLSSWLLIGRLDRDFLVSAIGVIMVILAVFVLGRPLLLHAWRSSTNDQRPGGGGVNIGDELDPRRPWLMSGGAVAGFLVGTFGVGPGLLTVPFLGQVQRMTIHRAAATTAAAGIGYGFAAVIGHSLAGNIKWLFLPPLVVGAVAGSLAGARLAGKLSERLVMSLLAAGLLGAGLPLLLT